MTVDMRYGWSLRLTSCLCACDAVSLSLPDVYYALGRVDRAFALVYSTVGLLFMYAAPRTHRCALALLVRCLKTHPSACLCLCMHMPDAAHAGAGAGAGTGAPSAAAAAVVATLEEIQRSLA